MTSWFRSWHGAPTDPKWRVVAKRANVPVATAIAVAWALMDHASQSEERGSIEGFDNEVIADFLGCEEVDIQAVIDAMTDKEILNENNGFANWEKRQPKREDGAAERAKSWRERKRTQPNASERTRTTQSRTEQIRTEQKEGSAKSDDSAPTYPKEFSDFWTSWRTAKGGGSKKPAFDAWKKLKPGERESAARHAVEYFDSWRRECPDATPLHGSTYLNQRRFEDFAERAAPTGDLFVASSSENFHPLRVRYRSERKADPPDAVHGGEAGAMFPAQWVINSRQVQHAAG